MLADGRVHPRVASAVDAAAAAGGGRPLERSTRARLEAGLGESLENVRVHTDALAGTLANVLSARAFAVSNDLFFAAGEYRPGSPDGHALIAHEATHAIQQRGAPAGGPLTVSSAGEELQAEAIARASSGNAGVARTAFGERPIPSANVGRASERRVARKLRVSVGDATDWARFCALVEPAAQVRLTRNQTNGLVSAQAASRASPTGPPHGPQQFAPGQAPPLTPPAPSIEFHTRLLAIVADPAKDAELHLGHAQPGVIYGGFRAGGEQLVDIDDIENVERWASGYGIAKLLHEIVENWSGHSGGTTQGVAYPQAHEQGMLAESRVVAGLPAGAGAGRGGARYYDDQSTGTFWQATDYLTHFLVVRLDSANNVTRAQRTAVNTVGTFTIRFAASSDVVDLNANSSERIAAERAHKNMPTMISLRTSRITGYTDGQEPPSLALSRAVAALAALNQPVPEWVPSSQAATLSGGAHPAPAPADRRCAVITVVEPAISFP